MEEEYQLKNKDAPPGRKMPPTQIHEYRLDLISHLLWRHFIIRYKGSVLGILWSMLLPLSQFLVLSFIFGKVVPLNIDAYPAFLFVGLLPWIWFSSSLSSFSGLFISNRDLLMKPQCSPSTLIIVETLSNLLNYLIFWPILFVVLAMYDTELTSSLMLLPALIMIQSVLTIGLGLIVATLNVFYRDVQHIVSVAVMLLFYMTPVFYKTEAIIERYQALFIVNPMAALIQGYRSIFLFGTRPEWKYLLSAAIISFFIYSAGYYIYRKKVDTIFDMI